MAGEKEATGRGFFHFDNPTAIPFPVAGWKLCAPGFRTGLPFSVISSSAGNAADLDANRVLSGQNFDPAILLSGFAKI